jgi:hypothetical protein
MKLLTQLSQELYAATSMANEQFLALVERVK